MYIDVRVRQRIVLPSFLSPFKYNKSPFSPFSPFSPLSPLSMAAAKKQITGKMKARFLSYLRKDDRK